MSAKESRLGVGLKGLSAFFDEEGEGVGATRAGKSGNAGFAVDDLVKSGDIVILSRDKIRPAANQPRKNFDAESIRELAASIRRDGILQPLLVRQIGATEFEIIAGERRWRAAELAELEKVPVIIKDISDEEVFRLALVENLQRENLSPIEEARGYRRLIDDYGYTQHDVAEVLNKSRPYVGNILRLLTLSEKLQAMVDSGQISYSVALAMAQGKGKKGEGAADRDPSIAMLEETLEKILAFPVEIKHKKGKGQLMIRFKDLSELDTLMKKLSA